MVSQKALSGQAFPSSGVKLRLLPSPTPSLHLWGSQSPTQNTLPGFGTPLDEMSARALGMAGELTVWHALEAAGYRVTYSERGAGDLKAINTATGVITRIEVKTSRRSSAGYWRFCLYKTHHTDWRHSDVLIMLAIEDDGTVIPFVLPSSKTQQRYIVMRAPATTTRGMAQWRRDCISLENVQ